MKLKMRIIWWALWISWVGIFAFVGWHNLDPDFGWHVQMGNYMAKKGIPKTDPFSYSMPSYPFIDHEWLTNRIMAEVFNHWGYGAEAVIFGVLAGGLLWLLIPRGKQIWALVPILMGTGVWVSRGCVRPQILDWVFLAGLLRFSWEEKVWKRWRFWVIPLFGLWANLHGGFAIGPVVLAAILVVKSWEKKKIDRKDIWVWVGGILATWINPYGPRLWHEVWMQMTDSNLRFSVAEWQPSWVRVELGAWLLVALVWMMLSKVGYRMEKWKLAVALCFLLAGISSLRHMSLLVVMMVLMGTELIERLAKEIKKNKLSWERGKRFYILLVAIAAIVFLEEVGVMVWKSGKGQGGVVYPVGAVQWLLQKNYSGQVFSEYGWGGYLIWKYTQKKVFMDGRMPSWRWIAPTSESDWAFKDYIKIRDKGDFAKEFNKYDIRVVLWPKYNLMGEIPKNNQGWWAKLMRIGIGKEIVDLKQKLEEGGWEKEYEDSVAVVYVKP